MLVRPPTPLKVRVLQAFLSDRVAVGAFGILVAMILIHRLVTEAPLVVDGA